MDLRTLAAAYDRSAAGYDERFRALQREKYRAAVPLLAAFRAAPGALALDAGAGTALFAEWIADAREPHADQRASLSSLRWVAADLSAGMLQLARRRAVLPLVCDLVRLPLHDRCCSLAVSFTSVLEEKPEALRELGRALLPGAPLLVSFLAAESPSIDQLARWSGLLPQHDPVPAGQDQLFLLVRPS